MGRHMLAAAAVALLAVGVHLPNHPEGRRPFEDAGVFLYAGQIVLDGGMPYLDVWDHKMPGIYYLDALGLLLAGGSPAGVWALQLAGFVLAALLGYRMLARELGPGAALFGSIAWLVAAPRLFLWEGQFTNFVQLYGVPLQFATLALATGEAMQPRATGRSIALGACAAAMFLLSPTLLGLPIAAAAYLAWTAARTGRRRVLAQRLAAAAATAALTIGAVALWFASRGALSELYDQAVRYNALYSSSATASERAAAIRAGLELIAPSGLAYVALVGWGLVAVQALRRRPLSPPIAIALLALPFDLFLGATSGRPYEHYYLTWLPSLGVLASYAAWRVVRAGESVGRTRVAALALTGLLLVGSAEPARHVLRAARASGDGSTPIAVAHLLATTRPDDPVLVWGSRTEIIVLASRRSPTRYVYQYSPLFTVGYHDPARWDELLRDLARPLPTVIIDASAGSPVTPPLDRAAARAFDTHDANYRLPLEIDHVLAYVEARYEHVATLPHTGWRVYRHRAR